MEHSGYAVAIIVESPQGIPLVRDFKKPSPLYWKLPGGRSEEGETAEETAARELQEEIGIILKTETLQLIHQENRGNHVFAVFRTRLPSLLKLKTGGEEDVKLFTLQQIADMQDFFPPHRKVLTEHRLL